MAWRITFGYDEDGVRVLAQQRLKMLSPPDDSGLLEKGRAGYWVELQDSAGNGLYRQVLSRPLQTEYEVFSPDPEESIRRVAAERVQGVFQVVLPDLAGGHEVVLHGPPIPDKAVPGQAEVLLRVRLREQPYDDQGGRQ